MAKVWRCAYRSLTAEGVLLVNVIHVLAKESVDGVNVASADTVRDAVDSWLTTKYKANIDNQTTLIDLTVTEEVAPGSGDVPGQSVKTLNVLGTATPSNRDLPVSATILLTLKTAAAVRSGHGRLFLPPPRTSTALSGQKWLTTWVNSTSAAGQFGAQLLTGVDWSAGGVTVGHISTIVYSRTRRARGDANYYFDVVAATPQQTVHWLRSRATAP